MTDMTKLPEALRIAGILRVTGPRHMTSKWIGEAFLELERQYDQIAELEAQLESVGAGGVGAMMGGAKEAVGARWYVVGGGGMATLCTDREDAEKEAESAQAAWPRGGPHRAVQLVEISQVQPAPAAVEPQQMLSGKDAEIAKLRTERDMWAYEHERQIDAKREIAEQLAAVAAERGALLVALQEAWLWMDKQADCQSKGGHATFDIMMLREQRDIVQSAIDAATAQAVNP